jgi:hypothetical protein
MTSLVTYSDSASNANAFASTFAFSPTQQPSLKKAKELASQRTGQRRQPCKLDTTTLRADRRATDNSGFKKLAVQWLNEHLCFVSSVVLADSFVLRNRQLLKPANRYLQA